MPPLPFVSHLLPDRAGDARHLVHALLIRFAVGIGDTGKLVCVVAQARRLVKQIGMVLTRPCPQLHAPDKRSQKLLAGKPAALCLLVQLQGGEVSQGCAFSSGGLG